MVSPLTGVVGRLPNGGTSWLLNGAYMGLLTTLGPQQPMENWRAFNPQYMGEITPKNEGNVGSHGTS